MGIGLARRPEMRAAINERAVFFRINRTRLRRRIKSLDLPRTVRSCEQLAPLLWCEPDYLAGFTGHPLGTSVAFTMLQVADRARREPDAFARCPVRSLRVRRGRVSVNGRVLYEGFVAERLNLAPGPVELEYVSADHVQLTVGGVPCRMNLDLLGAILS